MQSAPMFPASAPTKARIHWLVAVTCVVVILAAIGSALSTVREFVAGLATIAKPGTMEQSAYTNADAAHVTLTNLSNATLYQCVRGVVATNDKTKMERSVAVCTGDVKPHSTVVLDAPYKAGAIRSLCSGSNRQMDWDLCTFELEPVATPSAGSQ